MSVRRRRAALRCWCEPACITTGIIAGRLTSAPAFARASLCLALCLAAACGKKAPPLPPFSHVPAPVSTISARRVGDEVFLSFRVPSQNIDRSTPIDLVTIEVFALTTDMPPSRPAFLQHATRIAMFPVAPPPPPASDSGTKPAPGAHAAPPASPPDAAKRSPDSVAPGDELVVHEVLSADALVPVVIPPERGRGAPTPPVPPQSGAPSGAVADATKTPAPSSPRRYYVVVASNTRQRSSPAGAQASVSIAMLPPPPSGLTSAYDERTFTLSWNAAGGSESYNVYRDVPSEAPLSAAHAVAPVPVNGVPLTTPTYKAPVEFGHDMCFRVRTIRRDSSGDLLEGAAAEAPCKRPVDTFPPAPPADVQVIEGTGEITIQWLPNAEPDLAGYLVLRGTPGDATLAPITPLITATRYVDRVMQGVRYVYAVVAVDNAPVPNQSAPSAREEATAR
jgi:hypothetical protein